MRRTTLLALVVGIGASLFGAADAHAAWNAQNSGTTQWFRGLSCPTSSACFAGGDNGMIRATTNAGLTWTFQNAGTIMWFDGVSCPTAATCVAVGGAGTIRATANGGSTWSAQSSGTSSTLKQVSCATATSCVAVGLSGTIRATTNGGATWTAQSSGTTNDLQGVSCSTAAACVAVGASGTIRATTNGGSTWTAQSSGTTDWLGGVSCPTTATCVAVGSPGTIRATTNGGSTWTAQSSGTTQPLAGISCPTAATCVATGSGGTILATSNGGSTWTPQSSGTTALLYEVSCPTTADCWAAGGSGTILATNGIGDDVDPETTITGGPAEDEVWTQKTVTFTYASSDSGSTFKCAMDSTILTACPAAGMSYSTLSPGEHTFRVQAIDPSGNADPTPATRTFNYVGVREGSSENVGGGVAAGSVHFSGTGVPPAGATCAPTSFDLSGGADSVVVDLVLAGYAGPVALTGTGGSSCESATGGTGTLTLDVHGTGPTESRLDCVGLSGSYTRTLTHVEATLAGTCTINGFPAFVSLVFHGQFEPQGLGAGVSAPIQDADFQGPFVIAPT